MLETVKENLCVNKIVGNKTYEIVIEGDSIIPDSKPDILSAICETGNICIYKKEILEGKIRLDGNVNIYLMYLADGEEGTTRGFNANLDFTEILDFPDANSKMTLDENITIQNIECKVLNGRKVAFKVNLKVEARVFLNENEEMISEIHGAQDLQTQVVSLKMNSLIGQNTTKAMAKETIVVDGTDNLVEIVSSSLSIINKDTKISYNKVLAKADVAVKIVYLTDDGRIKSTEEVVPVMGFIDLVGVSEDDLCDVKYKFKNTVIKPNAMEEHSGSVEAEVEMFCRVFGNKDIRIIQDMYSPSRNLELTQNKVSTMINMQKTTEMVNIREKVKLDGSEYNKICDVIADSVITEKNILKDMVKFSGDLNLKFILLNEDETRVMTQEMSVPFSFNQEIEGVDRDSSVDCELTRIYQEFTKDNNDVSVKIDLEACINSYNVVDTYVIGDVRETEGGEENPYSMVIYFVKPGDSLWKIAKKYKSTIEDIARVNGIENPEKISVGMQLFIPRAQKIYA